jgi:hypothetical protein
VNNTGYFAFRSSWTSGMTVLALADCRSPLSIAG